NYNKKISVIPNPLREINDFYNKTYPKVVISMGRLIPSKNFIELIQIFDDSDCNKEWSLVILGEGPERENIENEIRRLSLEDRVELVGAVSDVDRYFSNASIFAFTSLSEGFPNALSEAI